MKNPIIDKKIIPEISNLAHCAPATQQNSNLKIQDAFWPFLATFGPISSESDNQSVFDFVK